MSILKDDVLKNKQKAVKNILDNLKAKKNVRIFLNEDSKEKYDKKKEIEKKYSQQPEEGGYDTSDLILNDYALYKRLLIVAKILETKGLAGELSVKGGFIFSTDDKVQEILTRLASKMDDPNISDAALETETKSLIFATDIDERINLKMDLDNNGIEDKLEDLDNNGIKDENEEFNPWKHIKDYQRDVQLDNIRQQQDENYRRKCEEQKRQNEKDREAEERKHGRTGLLDKFGLSDED